MRRVLPVLLALAPALACDHAVAPPAPHLADGLPATCSPLRTPGACMTPWPNALDLAADPSTKTGYRVALAPETLPVVGTTGAPFDPTRWNLADGFSPAGSLVAYFPERVDPATLVPEDAIGRSLEPGSATVLVDMTTGQRVAHFSGVDENARHAEDRQAVLITPAARLASGRQYAVGITRAARTLDGGMPTPPPLFPSMLAGQAPDDERAQAQLARMPAVFAALEGAGVERGDLLLAWDFVTGSDEAITGNVLSMRDQALDLVGPTGGEYTVTSIDEHLDASTLRRVRGTFSVPQFLDQADESKAEATLVLDPQGNPSLVGRYAAPFTVIIPASAAQHAPMPLVVYGHGLFGSGEGELGDASGSVLQDLANQAGVILVATDWIGLSVHENPEAAGSNGVFTDVLGDFSKLPWVTDRLQQALVNTMVLARTARARLALDPALTLSGKAGDRSLVDPDRIDYYGISLGGILGMSFLGYDPDVTRGALGSGGGFFSALFQRSHDWLAAELLLPVAYPDPLDVQLLLQLAQMQFDYADPATVAPHLFAAPLPGVPKKQILEQIGVGDAAVANVTSEMIARTAGLPLFAPNALSAFGLSPVRGPLPSALTTWDVHSGPVPPDTNQTPSQNNQVHEAVRRIPQAQAQLETFLSTGQIVDTCGGAPCNEPVPPGTPAPGL